MITFPFTRNLCSRNLLKSNKMCANSVKNANLLGNMLHWYWLLLNTNPLISNKLHYSRLFKAINIFIHFFTKYIFFLSRLDINDATVNQTISANGCSPRFERWLSAVIFCSDSFKRPKKGFGILSLIQLFGPGHSVCGLWFLCYC